MAKELENYRQKRDFRRTPEPRLAGKPTGKPLTFVIQKHHARQLHYDFRLELNGVLKSWSIPKGPSLDPAVKRLAVMVEDHPLDYASFEGTIPKGEYGAGEVIVWDRGVYSPDDNGKYLFSSRKDAEKELYDGLRKGKLSFFLRGQKLKGSWTLVKVGKSENNWLMIKHQDEYASSNIDILKQDDSILSDEPYDEKAGQGPHKKAQIMIDPAKARGSSAKPFPASMPPMMAFISDKPFSNPEWIFEPKLDGYRLIAFIKDGNVRLKSRRGIDVSGQYSALLSDLGHQLATEMIIDGEVIALDEKGLQCFQCLQQYLQSLKAKTAGLSENVPLIYYVFDILYLDGYDLTNVPLRLRKELLRSVLRVSDRIRMVDYFEGEGESVYKAAVENGLEGMIAKQRDSKYYTGKRSKDWLKVKSMRSDEFVIGGYSAGTGNRKKTFGALLLGYYDEKGKLQYAGHVGTGFDEHALKEIKQKLDNLKTARSPFSEAPPSNAETTWVRPELVAEVKFSQWTKERILRIPVFLRLRGDKSPREVYRAFIVSPPSGGETHRHDNADGSILHQLQRSGDSITIEVAGNKIGFTSLDRVLWPAISNAPAVTKRNLLSYLTSIAPYLLPHLKDRPLTLNRYPSGIYGQHFYQRHWNHPLPDFVDRVNVTGDDGKKSEYIICNNLSTLLWLGQQGNLEFNCWFSRTSPQPDMAEGAKDIETMLEYPDFIVFDLDPYLYSGKEVAGAEPALNRRAFAQVCEVARWLKEVLEGLSLTALVKTSGKTGLHIHVPVKREMDYKSIRKAAEIIGRFLLQRHGDVITMEWAVEKRTGKVFVDYNQNARGKSLASIYSPRPDPLATVSAPIYWDELGKIYPTDFTILDLPDRLKKTGDIWAGILTDKHDLRTLLEHQTR